MGAAAGYALIAFRFKNMHAGTRGSGGAEVGYGAPRAPSCTRSATPARAPLHPSHCASADASGGDIQQASEPRCEYRLERRGTRGGTSRRGGGGRRCMSKGCVAAHRRHLTEPSAAGAPTQRAFQPRHLCLRAALRAAEGRPRRHGRCRVSPRLSACRPGPRARPFSGLAPLQRCLRCRTLAALPHATCSGGHLRSHAATQAAEAARRYTAAHEEARRVREDRQRGSWGGAWGGGSSGAAGAAGGAAGGAAAAPSAALRELGLGDVPPHALTPEQVHRPGPKASSRERRSHPAPGLCRRRQVDTGCCPACPACTACTAWACQCRTGRGRTCPPCVGHSPGPARPGPARLGPACPGRSPVNHR